MQMMQTYLFLDLNVLYTHNCPNKPTSNLRHFVSIIMSIMLFESAQVPLSLTCVGDQSEWVGMCYVTLPWLKASVTPHKLCDHGLRFYLMFD